MDVVKSIRGMTTDDESVFVKMMDSQKIAGTSVSTTNYPMTNHVGDRRTHGALCTGTYLCHVHTVAYDPWITWITGSRRWTRYWSKWVFCCSCKPPQLAPNEGTKRRGKISRFCFRRRSRSSFLRLQAFVSFIFVFGIIRRKLRVEQVF